jgi:hypothetical protein
LLSVLPSKKMRHLAGQPADRLIAAPVLIAVRQVVDSAAEQVARDVADRVVRSVEDKVYPAK